MCPVLLLAAPTRSSLVKLQQSSVIIEQSWSIPPCPNDTFRHWQLQTQKIITSYHSLPLTLEIIVNSPDTEVYYHWVAHTPLHIPMHHDCRPLQHHCNDFRYLEPKTHPDWESSLACLVVSRSVLRLGRTCCLLFLCGCVLWVEVEWAVPSQCCFFPIVRLLLSCSIAIGCHVLNNF